MHNLVISPDILTADPNMKVIMNIKESDPAKLEKIQEKVYIALLMHHPKSNIYNIPEAEKIEIITGFYPKFSFEDANYKQYRELIINSLLTASERSLITLEKKLLELNSFIENTAYTLENVKLLNDAQIAIDKLTDTIKNIREKLAIESDINSSSFLEDMYTEIK